MHASVAFGTEGYQILLRIIARRAAEFFVMEFKIGHCATRLASPAVATQHLLAQTVIRIGIEPHGGERMQSRYGDLYVAALGGTAMFLPGEPGARLGHMLFGWVRSRRLRLFAIYCLSLVVAITGAFALRQLSLRVITHLSFWDGLAAISFLRDDTSDLGTFVQLAKADPGVQERLTQRDSRVLVQVMEGRPSVVHVMIDAGMTRTQARNLPLAEKGVKLVFLRPKDQYSNKGPFDAGARWQPAFIVERVVKGYRG
jgi:hypothetical protein